ncbi:MAG: n-acetylglutamate synthase [Anaerolineae bacterium]|nr:n-acetylglutamate synthase [Anaerolineae bacterium]
MAINYEDKQFRSVANTKNGEVSGDTVFHYRQQGNIVWATYSGGSIRWGTLIATVAEGGDLNMRYQHINLIGELMTGECQSKPETLCDGRLRLHETWQWTSGDKSRGSSIVEEIK